MAESERSFGSFSEQGSSNNLDNILEYESVCTVCGASVGKRYFRPRHHCRVCNRAVCGACSRSFVTIEGKPGLHRTCNDCVAHRLVPPEERRSSFLGFDMSVAQPLLELESTTPRRVRIVIVGCTRLRDADALSDARGESDPYCVCTVRGAYKRVFQTNTVQDNLNPVWNHVEDVEWDGRGDMKFEVFDRDTFTRDDTLGKITLHAKRIAWGFEGELPLRGPGVDSTGPGATLDFRLIRGFHKTFHCNAALECCGKRAIGSGRIRLKVLPEGADERWIHYSCLVGIVEFWDWMRAQLKCC